MAMTQDPAYLHHRGKPVVAVWGIGFNAGRKYTLAEGRRLIEFLKNDPQAGGCTVRLSVPAHWRELKGDAVNDPALLTVLAWQTSSARGPSAVIQTRRKRRQTRTKL
jgi:hypothetical protein